MSLPALSVGSQVPTSSFSATVHSLFRGACNLEVAPSTMLTLLPSAKANLPHGIRLDHASFHTVCAQIRIGQAAACRSRILRFNGSELAIDLRVASPWHIDLSSLCLDLRAYERLRAWTTAWSELKRRQEDLELVPTMETCPAGLEDTSSSMTASLLGHQGDRAASALVDATSSFSLDDAVRAMRRLIGLGVGLTPSGDDFLVGYLAGLWSTACGKSSRLAFLRSIGARMCEDARNTNVISRVYLLAASKGHVSEPLAVLVQHLATSLNQASVLGATKAALSIGHTSGADGVLGLLLGCIPWNSKAERTRLQYEIAV